jgi:dolichol-phosphate mannosyltransferase
MPVEISIIIPVFNEAENISPLADEVVAAMASSSPARNYELVFVDDGSKDDTWSRIEQFHARNPRVRGLKLERNSGQSAALWTGIIATDGPVLATLDGDRQNDPADLPALLGMLSQCDFVSGRRVSRQDSVLRRISSRVARLARKVVLGADFADTGCGLRVFKRTALDGVFPFNGLHRFLPILVHGNGSVTREVPVNHRPRVAGVSKYGIGNRLFRGIFDLFALAWYQERRYRPVRYAEIGNRGNEPH